MITNKSIKALPCTNTHIHARGIPMSDDTETERQTENTYSIFLYLCAAVDYYQWGGKRG